MLQRAGYAPLQVDDLSKEPLPCELEWRRAPEMLLKTTDLEERHRKIAETSHKPKPFKVVSFFTENNEYAEHAARLRSTLESFHLEHELHPVRDDGPWEFLCARKARFVRERWQASDVPIVWLDADATVESFPALFGQLDADFAIHKWNGWQFASGTIYFGKTALAEGLIEQWVRRCEADPVTWDQTHLQSAWCDVAVSQNIRTFWLPRSYCQIFDSSEEDTPIIKHWQASRIPKSEGRVSGQPQLEITPRGVEQRRGDGPWRIGEGAFWISQEQEASEPEFDSESPKGFDVGSTLKDAIDGRYPVLEIGCGSGRIAKFFEPVHYIGIDQDPSALIRAKNSLPHHGFRIFDDGYDYPAAPTAMFFKLLHNVPNELLPDMLQHVARNRSRIIIAEVMNGYRQDGEYPFIYRDPETYTRLMEKIGLRLAGIAKLEGDYYGDDLRGSDQNMRLMILSFKRSDGTDTEGQLPIKKKSALLPEIFRRLPSRRPIFGS
jgi:SAM-dependent methyltransferase